ncbi:MAG: hypothetical protein E6Q24_09990 [Chitinophagaceae bacterium]|jgi:hypothetical protein|nr:MAG: hypothetical protein E6Q24_09990 [Chitinophagaceae bacterium]HEX2848688.1 hypothetical protein [Chitinophagaceae bacterium]
MKLQKYELKMGKLLKTFEFISEGRKGKILKFIKFEKTGIKNVYNLLFGDKNSKHIDDYVVSNNGDAEKVLATVAEAIVSFTNRYPSSWIYAEGSSRARTRLYQMGINRHLSEILETFEVFGLKDNEWQKFKKESAYDAFLVTRKQVILKHEENSI